MKMTWLKIVVTLTLAALIFSGCAKKPAVTQEETAGMREEATTTTEMPSREIRGIEERAVTESRSAREEGTAEARRSAEEVPNLERIYFDFDQYTLSQEAREILEDNAEYLQNNPSINVKIEGHADERGSDEYNLALGERRALAAKNYLVSLGIQPQRLTIISYGEELPLVSGRTEEAMAKNRRAEFKEIR